MYKTCTKAMNCYEFQVLNNVKAKFCKYFIQDKICGHRGTIQIDFVLHFVILKLIINYPVKGTSFLQNIHKRLKQYFFNEISFWQIRYVYVVCFRYTVKRIKCLLFLRIIGQNSKASYKMIAIFSSIIFCHFYNNKKNPYIYLFFFIHDIL